MQKISSYLYPNRVELLSDLAGFSTEFTNVYQRTIKIYKGVDNVIEFNIKNADQKRLELNTSPAITDIKMNVMDASGNALPDSPYDVTPSADIKGIAVAVIPASQLDNINHQFLRYSVTATQDSNTILLYADSRFGAIGTIEVVGTAMPVTRGSTVNNRFSGEVNFNGDVINHTSAIPAKFYEAVPTQSLSFTIEMTNYIGDVYLEATKDSTISVESFRTEQGNAAILATRTYTSANSTPLSFDDISTEGWNYFRVSWRYIDKVLIGVNSPYPTGTVDKVTVN